MTPARARELRKMVENFETGLLYLQAAAKTAAGNVNPATIRLGLGSAADSVLSGVDLAAHRIALTALIDIIKVYEDAVEDDDIQF